MKKRYVALARVSSEEQEREGFSLDVQEDAIREWVKRDGGEIVKLYRMAETAHKSDRRKGFREIVSFVKKHAASISGLVFYKTDRVVRNMKDWVELLEIRDSYGVKLICITEPFDETSMGRFTSTMLAAMAQHFSDQLSERTRSGVDRRVKSGLFPGHAPYGYRNVRRDGRGLVEIHPENGPKVRRMFDLYASHGHTLDSLRQTLMDEGIRRSPRTPSFHRSMLHSILTSRAYIGDVFHRGEWYPGTHPPLVDRGTWDRVQVLLGNRAYQSHELAYAGCVIRCGHCGRPITGEVIRKKKTGRVYVYYRCSDYNAEGHPRHRVTEADLDRQMLALFESMRIQEKRKRDWVVKVLRERVRYDQRHAAEERDRVRRDMVQTEKRLDRLVHMRLNDEIELETFERNKRELQDELFRLSAITDRGGRDQVELAEIAVKTFELSQALQEKWVRADVRAKRQIMEILFLNLTLDGTTLCHEMRKPFRILSEGLSLKVGRAKRTQLELFAQSIHEVDAGITRLILAA